MRVVQVHKIGGLDGLQVVEVPDPVPGPGQVVVRVAAAPVNPADVAAREGEVPGPPVAPPFITGWDLAGTVAAVGEGVTGFRPGDRVAGLLPWYLTHGSIGAHSELVASDAEWMVPLPDNLDFVRASTVPLNALTARQALELAALPPGSPLLVTGASGGLGTFTVQLAVRAGLEVTAIAGRGAEDWVRELGAHRVLPRDTDPASLGPVPNVLDLVPLGDVAAAAVADGGVLITTRPTPLVDPRRKIRQQVVLIRPDRAALAELIEEVAAGRLRTRVAGTLPLAEVAEAHRLVELGGLPGKIVLVP
jgi:NADPH:quinone reductase-like Zn-dependent oxidoreductase